MINYYYYCNTTTVPERGERGKKGSFRCENKNDRIVIARRTISSCERKITRSAAAKRPGKNGI